MISGLSYLLKGSLHAELLRVSGIYTRNEGVDDTLEGLGA
jgi:hypothetical protein